MTRARGLRVALAAACLLQGCAVGPNFHTPAAPATLSYTQGTLTAHDGVQSFVSGLDIPGEWWTLFRNPALDHLIRRALAPNPTQAAGPA